MRGNRTLGLRAFALLLFAAAPTLALPAPAAAQGSYSPFDETPTAALARYVRTLASSPKDFTTLIGAGHAALALGDAQAAAGFFARADEVNPRSPLPQAGMGAVSVANGEPFAALPYFARAQQLGAPVSTFACDRGLAFDLLGRQAEAQADYRLALTGRDGEEARRRLALSLAISGDRAGALAAIAPLLAKNDAGAARSRAFVLALTGDTRGAMTAIDGAMPGSWSQVAPFLGRLPALKAGEKAAAVNLGIFPEAGEANYASAAPVVRPYTGHQSAPSTSSVVASIANSGGERLAGVDALLGPPPAAAPPPAQIAYAAPPRPKAATAQQPLNRVQAKKIWLQLASGQNADALPGQFNRIKSKNRNLFDGITGFVAKGSDRARLVIGPFRSAGDAEIFAEDLESIDVTSFRWSNSETDMIVPLGTE
jgi:Flp pilus assembly protein TadD